MTTCAWKLPEMRSPLLSLLFLLMVLIAAPASEERAARATLVLFNHNAPGSEELARYYAEKRSIPATNLIGLECPITEEISREEYLTTISAPLRGELMRRALWSSKDGQVINSRLRYAAVMKGVPLKIRTTMPPAEAGEKRDPIADRDEASVDSELSVLGLPVEAHGAVRNMYFRSFTPAMDAQVPPGMLLVCRLDGPSDEVVRSMIDDALEAERRGLWGWGYVDLRGLGKGPYYEGDKWLNEAAQAMRRAGVPVLTDREEATLPTGFPVRQAAVYYGWYAGKVNGPFAEAETEFVTGAIAVHIHSFSASTIRDPLSRWVAPLLARGAAVSAGNVYEPYLGMSLHLDLFQDRLMAGLRLADAAYAATPALSWMGVILGDPLYRPYAYWHQLRLAAPSARNEWQQYRDLVLSKSGNMLVASPFLLDLARRLHNPMPAQAVASWEFDRQNFAPSIAAWEQASSLAVLPWQKTQIDWLMIQTFVAAGQKEDAVRVARDAFGRELTPGEEKLMLREIDRIYPPANGNAATQP